MSSTLWKTRRVTMEKKSIPVYNSIKKGYENVNVGDIFYLPSTEGYYKKGHYLYVGWTKKANHLYLKTNTLLPINE